ncbi:Riboflavin transporter [Aphelenchoides fujianensis]|nr:Riboflavin transporter [Aphelenchoides fujianensis]
MLPKVRPNPLVYFLVAYFASAPWLGNYTAFIEMSIFTRQLPEGWNLGSLAILTIQLSAIGPLIFMLFDRCIRIPMRHGVVIQVAMVVSALMHVPMIFGWNWTLVVFGQEHSITFFATIFVFGCIAIGSDVVFMPFMATFDPVYLPAWFVGSGISSLLLALLSLAQGTSSHTCVMDDRTGKLEPQFVSPRFSVGVFYTITFAYMVGACVAFYLLNNHLKRVERCGCWGGGKTAKLPADSPMLDDRSALDLRCEQPSGSRTSSIELPHKRTSRVEDWAILFCIGLVGAETNVILPSVQSFASIPYSQTTYFWVLILSTVLSPLSAFVAGFLTLRSTRWIVLLSALAAAATSFVVLLALQSPNPWLKNCGWGSAMTIVVQTVAAASYPFVQTLATMAYRDADPLNEDRLFWTGLAVQIGSFIGTVVVYPSVNMFNFFHEAPLCQE